MLAQPLHGIMFGRSVMLDPGRSSVWPGLRRTRWTASACAVKHYPGCQRFLALGSQQLWLRPREAGGEAGVTRLGPAQLRPQPLAARIVSCRERGTSGTQGIERLGFQLKVDQGNGTPWEETIADASRGKLFVLRSNERANARNVSYRFFSWRSVTTDQLFDWQANPSLFALRDF